MLKLYALERLSDAIDPVTAVLTKDYASLGGWSLFIGLVILIVVGVFRGWWVPGWMYRDQAETLNEAMSQNKELLASAIVAKHFFETTAAKRGEE